MAIFRDGRSKITDRGNPPPLNLPRRYHLLSIAIDKYLYDQDLENAVNEAEQLRQVLSDYYGFEHCIQLYNEQATQKKIDKALGLYAASLNSGDALLIHYAGHGKAKQLGNTAFKTYEAEPWDQTTWREHSGFIEELRAIKARYILLLIDSCYAGGIFTGSAPRGGGASTDSPSASYVGRIAERTSRIALTSGGLEPVPDLSQFAQNIIGCLRDNQSPWLLSGKLFTAAQSISGNTTPAIFHLNNNDSGAEFIFYRRDLGSSSAATPPTDEPANPPSSDSRRPSKYWLIGILALLPILAVAFLFGLGYNEQLQGYLEDAELKRADESAWSIALAADNLVGYQKYLRDCWPTCAFRHTADQRIEELRDLENRQQQAELKRADESAWGIALAANNLASYESYLRYCNSVCAFRRNAEQRVRGLSDLENQQQQAELRSADESAWSVALNTNNLAGYEGYLRNCNSICAFRRNAERQVGQLRTLENQQQQAQLKRADEAAWSAALQANILADYQRYLRNCNSVCAFRSNAERRVRELKDLENQRQAKLRQDELKLADRLAWTAASNNDKLTSYQDYLRNCNSVCAFRSNAEQSIDQLREFTLTIRSNVYSDQVWIDGRSYGSTPVSVQLKRGSYSVRVSKSGYEDYSERIELTRARTLQVQLQRKGPAPGDIIQDCSDCPKMVYIPAGSFRMGDIQGGGDSDERPVHRVSVGAFGLGQTEVTVAQFRAFADASGYKTEAEQGDGCYVYANGSWDKRSNVNWRNPGFKQSDEEPVVCTSWNDAQRYIEWLSTKTGEQYRLPTEAEWEYAARAGSETKYFFGNNSDDMCKYGNGADLEAKKQNSGWVVVDCNDGHYRTAPAASFTANAFGIHDMHGNVWEWTQDCWNGSYEGAPSDGTAWLSGNCGWRVLRGGSWFGNPYFLRSANRGRGTTDYRVNYSGFRLARTLD